MSEQDDSPKKAMSFKDRIAMFNQPKAAAPAPGPPPRATKPRAFKWKTSGEGEEGSSKTLSVADVPPQPPTPTPGAAASSAEGTQSEQPAAALTDKPAGPRLQASGAPLEPVSSAASGTSVVSAEDSVKHKGFSAEDARQSAGSLKERIALLSGLKVDKPDAPGRAPKPWRKKTQEPAEGEELAASTAAPGALSPSSEQAPSSAAAAEAGQEESKAEPGEDSNVAEAAEKQPDDVSAPKSAAAAEEPSTSTNDEKHSIALPKMPTRARGPQRKARGGHASPAVASPASEAAPIASPTKDDITNRDSIPSISDIGSPSAGPEELGDPIPAAVVDSQKSIAEEPLSTNEHSKDTATDDNAASRSIPKRTSTNLLARAVPLPPPTAQTTQEEAEEDAEHGEQADPGSDEVKLLTSNLSRQSLGDDEQKESDESVSAARSPVSRPPAPPPLDTAVSATPASTASPAEVTSPTSGSTNRRSMTRPPVPSAYSQDSAPPPASPRSSFDNRSQRSSIAGSQRGSLIMSPSEQQVVMAEPEAMAGDGEFANPALDSKEKIVVPPPVSKPFDTDSAAASPVSPTSQKRQDSTPVQQQRRTSGIVTGGSAVSGKAPTRSDSTLSQRSAAGASAEQEAEETNISAMKAYRAPSIDEKADPKDEAEEEEEEYEDPEVARRQALAKRMAAMGGMKIGMLPQMPSMVKRKKTLPKESEPSETSEPAQSAPPADQAPASPVERQAEPEPAERPSPSSGTSFRPPAGAFVLPMPGRPRVPPPAVPPPAVPPPPAPQHEENEDEDKPEYVEDEEESSDRDVHEGNTQDDPAADDTTTRPLEEDEVDESEPPPPPPPPIPAARPPPPPPVGQSFIETDTDTEGGRSEYRNSMASSTGVGSLSDFPAPPEGASPGIHNRTQSSASRYSSQDRPDTMYEESESVEGYGSEQTETILPPRPARAPPPLDTSASISEGRAPSRRESMAEPTSPTQSVHSYSQRSLPETPVSPSAKSTSQERFGALSPTTSQSSKRSSAMLSGQQGGAPGLGNIQPGLNNQYLAYIAINSAKTKSREVDGPLAHTLNDIAYTYRNDPVNFGSIVYRMLNTGVKGQVPELDIHGRIEPGCVFFAWDAKFDRGLGRSSLKVGSAEVPHVGIVAEGVKDIKKAKVKVVELVQGRHNIETYRLDDLKSGLVEIRRLA